MPIVAKETETQRKVYIAGRVNDACELIDKVIREDFALPEYFIQLDNVEFIEDNDVRITVCEAYKKAGWHIEWEDTKEGPDIKLGRCPEPVHGFFKKRYGCECRYSYYL